LLSYGRVRVFLLPIREALKREESESVYIETVATNPLLIVISTFLCVEFDATLQLKLIQSVRLGVYALWDP